MEFVVYTDAKGQGRWRLVGRNGKILADSGESYTRRRDAVRAVRQIQQGASGLASSPVTVSPGVNVYGTWPKAAGVSKKENTANARTLLGLAVLAGER